MEKLEDKKEDPRECEVRMIGGRIKYVTNLFQIIKGLEDIEKSAGKDEDFKGLKPFEIRIEAGQ